MNVWRALFRAKVRVLRVQPGDVVTLTTTAPLTPTMAATIKAQFERKFPDVRVCVMSEGLHPSGVIRPEQRATTRPERPPHRPSTIGA